MNLPQENFERALVSARDTIKELQSIPAPNLGHESNQRLRAWMWDLEAIGSAIRLELMNRETLQPVDFG